LETTQEGAAAWLPGEDRLAFLLANSNGVVPFSGVGVYDFAQKKVQKLFGGNPDDPDFSLPAWSPDGKWLLTSQRTPGGNPARQLSLFQADGSQEKVITDDPTSNAASYRWDAWGREVVFLQVKMGVADAEPQVMVWDRETGQVRKVASGTLPEWLP
jgi:Tol biopolymer transport system component